MDIDVKTFMYHIFFLNSDVGTFQALLSTIGRIFAKLGVDNRPFCEVPSLA